MRLANSPRAVHFKPTARMDAPYTISAVAGANSIHLSDVTKNDALDQSVSHGHTEHARRGKTLDAHVKELRMEESVEYESLFQNGSVAQDKFKVEPPRDSEYISSQDQEGNTTEQLNDEKASDKEEEEEQEQEVEEHTTLDYQIPEDVLRTAMLASPNTNASFWSAKMYRGPDGQSLSTHYCRSMEVAERVAQYFTKEKVVGFDIEWRPYSSTKNIKQNASLIQLACEDRIALFHIALFPGSTPEELMPPTLRTVLESPDIYKVGVAVKGDFTRLKKYLNIQAQGVFELSRLHNLVESYATDSTKISNKLVGLAAQVLQHLQLPLYKGAQLDDDPADTANVRQSDWSKPLDVQQIHYAAADAYAGFRLFHILEWKRKQLRPTPPIRGICDYDAKPASKPKVLKKEKVTGNPKSSVNTAAKQSESALEPDAEQENDEEESEEEGGYETTPEELMDSHELEDPVSAPSASSEQVGVAKDCNTIDEITHTRKRVGRVNPSWLHGPDPGYPTLPQESEEDYDTLNWPPVDHSIRSLTYDKSIDPLFNTCLPRLDEEAEDDEFADKELEEALQTMALDEDGKLKDIASPLIVAAGRKENRHVNSAREYADSRKILTKVDYTHAAEMDDSIRQATCKVVELSDYNPIDLNTKELTTTSPLTFHSLTQPTNEASHTPEYHVATTWAQNHLQSTIPSPTSTAPSRIRATVPHLRAYHLWHHQKLSLDDIASCLRNPPLSHSTVTGYILQAVSLERLEYDNVAMRDMMMKMPTSLRKGRWKWMAEKVGAMN
jgi:hypothetical protein